MTKQDILQGSLSRDTKLYSAPSVVASIVSPVWSPPYVSANLPRLTPVLDSLEQLINPHPNHQSITTTVIEEELSSLIESFSSENEMPNKLSKQSLGVLDLEVDNPANSSFAPSSATNIASNPSFNRCIVSGQPIMHNLSIQEPGTSVAGKPRRPDMYFSSGISMATSVAESGIFTLSTPPLQLLQVTEQLLSVEDVFNKYSAKIYQINEAITHNTILARVKFMAVRLARESFFGDSVLMQSTVTGKSGYPLDRKKYDMLLTVLHSRFQPEVHFSVFKATLARQCSYAIAGLCKRLRSQKKIA